MYAATVAGRHLTFEVTGVWRRNMVMRDRETGSIWQQATGECVAGPLRDRQLDLIGGEQTTWAAWRRDHPATTVMMEPAGAAQGMLPHPMLIGLIDLITPNFAAPGLAGNDTRLPMHEEVAGIEVAGAARAYALSVLRKHHLINDQVGRMPVAVLYESEAQRVRAFVRTINGEPVVLQKDNANLTAAEGTMRWDLRGEPVAGTRQSLQPITVERQWWLGWSEFHPHTTIYEKEA